MTKTTLKIIVSLALLVLLAACQTLLNTPISFISGTPVVPTPAPLTGDNASQLGASALTIRTNNGPDHFALVPISADTGKPLTAYQPIDFGLIIHYAFSADRTKMAYFASGTADCHQVCLRVLDLRTWKQLIQPIPVGENSDTWNSSLVLDAQVNKAILIYNDNTDPRSHLNLIDLSQGKTVQKTDLDFNVFQAGFLPDGSLSMYGNAPLPSGKNYVLHVALLDGTDLKVTWQKDLENVPFMEEYAGDPNDPTLGKYYNPATVFTSDYTRLYVVAADEPKLVSVDFKQKTIQTAAIQPKASLLDRLMAIGTTPVYAKSFNGVYKSAVLSNDGRYLYVSGSSSKAVKDSQGNVTAESTPLGLQIIDTRDGTLLNSLDNQASEVSLSPDGKTLLLTHYKKTTNGLSDPQTDILDVKTLKTIQQLDGYARPTLLLDGSTAWLTTVQREDGSSRYILFTPGSTKARSEWQMPDNSSDWATIP